MKIENTPMQAKTADRSPTKYQLIAKIGNALELGIEEDGIY
jgi:hypothetical protein